MTWHPARRSTAGTCCVLLLAVCLGACGASKTASSGEALVGTKSHLHISTNQARVGEPLLMRVWDAGVRGGRPAHLLRAELVGVSRGLSVDGIWAVSYSESVPLAYHLGGARGWEWVRKFRPYSHPISDVVLDPRCPPQAHCQQVGPDLYQDWYLYAQVHVTGPGQVRTTGLKVTYEVDGNLYEQTLTSQTIGANTGGANTGDAPLR